MEHIAIKTRATPEVLGSLTCALASLLHPRDWMRKSARVRPRDLLKRTIDRDWGPDPVSTMTAEDAANYSRPNPNPNPNPNAAPYAAPSPDPYPEVPF